MHVESISNCCTKNSTNLNINKMRVISSTRKVSMISFEYKLRASPIICTDDIKDLMVFFYLKLYLYQHVDCTSSQALKFLSLIRAITFSFSTVDSLLTLYFT
jgi:hypothetical protein